MLRYVRVTYDKPVRCVQRATPEVQSSDGLDHVFVDSLELWRRRHGRHPLEGPTASTADLPYHYQCSYRTLPLLLSCTLSCSCGIIS